MVIYARIPPADLLLQVTALLHGYGVRLLGEHLAHLGEVAVLRNFVLNLRGVVDEGELGVLAVDNLCMCVITFMRLLFFVIIPLYIPSEILPRCFSRCRLALWPGVCGRIVP